MTDHPDRQALFLYVDDDPALDASKRQQVAAHVAICSACAAESDRLLSYVSEISKGGILRHLLDSDAGRDARRLAFLAHVDRLEDASSAAGQFYDDHLGSSPVESWQTVFTNYPAYFSAAMARRILREVDIEMNRRPKRALQLIAVAEQIANACQDVEARELLGDVWKQRSNAFRHLSRYDEALDAAALAQEFYASLPVGAYDVAQAQYTRVVALFKMTQFDLALAELTSAITTLRTFGLTVPLLKALVLEATIRAEQGDIPGAEMLYRDVLPLIRQLDERIEEARVLANLGDLNYRLGKYNQAVEDAETAIDRYRKLKMDAEAIRSAWTLALAHLASGDDGALDELHAVAVSFDDLGMVADAGLVRLDIVEDLLHRGEWEEAADIARQLAVIFTKAGVTLPSVAAVDFLRRAVEHHEATTATIQYVRDYVTADDPERIFRPPSQPS